MKPIEFKQQNLILAKDQPEYRPLPVLRLDSFQGDTISCWKLSWRERFKLMFTGKIWISMLTFRRPPMPILPTTNKGDVIGGLS
ncbi:MAG: hypothetical protein K9N29_11140 [Candidatus Marinimicrobia bacterium]|nr:hypothetical protein [Candidatus Neomarinimicrobiota bacterium]